jgi:hypothetical protein
VNRGCSAGEASNPPFAPRFFPSATFRKEKRERVRVSVVSKSYDASIARMRGDRAGVVTLLARPHVATGEVVVFAKL